MNITGEYRINADRERVWTALNDPDVLRRCIPGCESLEQVNETELNAVVKAAVGPVRARFNSRLTLENLNPPESYTLTGDSKAGAAGFGRGAADVRLESVDGGTQLTYSAEFKVGGKLAQVGSRLVAGATKKTADDFFGNFAKEFEPVAAESVTGEAVDEAAETALPPSRIGVSVLLVSLVLLIAWYLLG